MPCLQPLPAWKTLGGAIDLHTKEPADTTGRLLLPCGTCLNCRSAWAQEWTVRCQLELSNHASAAWATLTYSEENVPPTLTKPHVQGFLKRLRKRIAKPNRRETTRPVPRVSYFYSGEYGEENGRPHYHAILYGPSISHAQLIEEAWGLGHAHVTRVTPANIAYTCGYTAKKIERTWLKQKPKALLDPTGTYFYKYQPPFVEMSTNPAIGANGLKWPHMWRNYAITNGFKVPAPRYLHDAWKAQATPQEIEQLEHEVYELTKHNVPSELRRQADAAIAEARHKQRLAKRRLA